MGTIGLRQKLTALAFVGAVSPVLFGFKVGTHIASANRTLDILEQEIHPTQATADTLSFVVRGQTFSFDVESKAAYAAIMAHPEFFRAGAIGPDGFPDMISGQSFQHSNESPSGQALVHKTTNGDITVESLLETNPSARLEDRARPSQLRSIDFAMLMLARRNQMVTQGDLSPLEAEQALAFIMGYISHCVGDAFAHHWVNELTTTAFDMFTGEGGLGTVSEEVQHTVVEAWVDSFVPGNLQNEDGSVGGQHDRYVIRIPERFLTAVFADRMPNLPEYGDRTNPAGFMKYYRDTSQFMGGPIYNYLNLQAEVGERAVQWAFLEWILNKAAGTAPSQNLQDLLLTLDIPAQVIEDIDDWTEGDFLEFVTGLDCDLFEDSTDMEALLQVWNFLSTFGDRVDAYTAKAEAARANWLKMSECSAQNVAWLNGPDFDPNQPEKNRDACTLLAEKAENGIFADNDPDGDGLVREGVTDQAWLNGVIAHFKGQYTSVFVEVADGIGDEYERQLGDQNPYIAMIRGQLFSDSAESSPYEPNNKHRSLAQNLARQLEFLTGPAFLMDDFRDTLLGSQLGGKFDEICVAVTDEDKRECLDLGLRAAFTAYEAAGLGICGAEFVQCKNEGITACSIEGCKFGCQGATFGFGGESCDNACSQIVEGTCKSALEPLCPSVCAVPGCVAFGECVPNPATPPVGVPYVITDGMCTWPTPSECCSLGEVKLDACLDVVADMCTSDNSEEECQGFFSFECDEELALECSPDKVQGIVNNVFGFTDYAGEILDPIAQFCAIVRDPMTEFSKYVVGKDDEILKLAAEHQYLISGAAAGATLLALISDSWRDNDLDAQVNAVFVNEDVTSDATYAQQLRSKAATTRNNLLAGGAGPNALNVVGLQELINAIDNGDPYVVGFDLTAPTTWEESAQVTGNNVSNANKLNAVLDSGVFDGIEGPTLRRMKQDMGTSMLETFDPFFNTVHGMKLVPLNAQADIDGIFDAASAGAQIALLPWHLKDNSGYLAAGPDEPVFPYSALCVDPSTTNIYCDVLISNDDPSCTECQMSRSIVVPDGAPELGWNLDRGLIAFNEYSPSGGNDHFSTYFPLSNSDEAYEKLYKRVFRTPQALPEELGFEGDLSQWRVVNGNATLTGSPTASQGSQSLVVNGCNTVQVQSPRFSTTELSVVSHQLSLDVRVPTNAPPHWRGQVQLSVSVPGANVNNQSLGTVELTNKPAGAFSTLQFVVPQNVYNAFAGDFAGLQFTIQLVVPCGTASYQLDNLRFTGDVSDRTVFHTQGSAALSVRTNNLLGFENGAQWSVDPWINATLASEGDMVSEGMTSLKITGGGYIPVKSITFSTSGLPVVGNKLHLDVFVPRPQREYYWVGDVRVELSCPAQGINETVSNEQKSLTHLFEDEFNSLTFTLKPNIKTALQTPGRSCSIRPVLNITYGPPSGTFYFDNMGFIQ